jgi:hypothetical protein
VFNDIEVKAFRIGAVVPADEVASFDEAALAVADGLNQSQLTPTVSGLYNWLVRAQRHWSAIVRAADRTGTHVLSAVQPLLRQTHDPIIAQPPGCLAPTVWSASRSNTVCALLASMPGAC